jgi:microcystin degradation protein MlrC
MALACGRDPARVRALVVESCGHFRAAFDECFGDDRLVEVGVPGLTTPVLADVPWRRMPRPIHPLGPDLARAPPD